jgi:hypothetical protein
MYTVLTMKVLLTTIAIGENYLKEYETNFKESQENYAKKCGYDFKVITDYLDTQLRMKQTISFNKILVCSQEWSKNYDMIIFVDADILININSPPLHNYIDYGNLIGIVDEYSQPTTKRRINIQKRMGWESSGTDYYKLCNLDIQTELVMNTGVLVLQPKLHDVFLKNIYDKYVIMSVGHYRGYIFEQTCIGYELQKEQKYKILPNEFNAVWGLTKLEGSISNIQNISLEYYFKCNFFTHFAGGVDLDKVYSLHKNYNILDE